MVARQEVDRVGGRGASCRRPRAEGVQLNKAVTHLESELNKPLDTGTVNTQMAGEIRTMRRKEMTEKERAEFINTAIESNDTRALLAVPGWLRLDCWP
jgi:hypothetical protein